MSNTVRKSKNLKPLPVIVRDEKIDAEINWWFRAITVHAHNVNVMGYLKRIKRR